MQLALFDRISSTIDHLQHRLSVVETGPLKVIDAIQCVDGFTLSVQASTFHACTPRASSGPYRTVEVMAGRGVLPSRFMLEEEDVCDEPMIYRFVPIDMVAHVIDAHGGILGC